MLKLLKVRQSHAEHSTSAMAIEHSRNMETRDHSNGVSLKSHTSRGNNLIQKEV